MTFAITARMIGGMRMKIVNMPVRVPVSHIKHGHVFKYKDKYYMATNAYYGAEMGQKNKVYVELETGFWKVSLMNLLNLLKTSN